MKKGFLQKILRLKQTVFSFKELLLFLRTDDVQTVKSQVNYYVKKGDLYNIRRGLYAKDAQYDPREVATKIFTPAYISFETVLLQAGINFQLTTEIHVASYQTRTIECDKQIYVFRKLKSSILMNTMGIELQDTYSIASPKRAFLDIIYLQKSYHFDNLDPLNWDKVYLLLPIYGGNKRIEKMVRMYHESYLQQKNEANNDS